MDLPGFPLFSLFSQIDHFLLALARKETLVLMTSPDQCVLLFSGGRDSTVAALRLSEQFKRLVLITVTSAHMDGIERVRSRVLELKKILRAGSEWMLLGEPAPFSDARVGEPSGCISCHFGYFLIASAIADQMRCGSIACGFVAYQEKWVEQTSYAIQRLEGLLAQHGKRLILPVLDIQDRDKAEAELRLRGLSTESLELKCLRQQIDPGLTGSALKRVVDRWIDNLRAALERKQIPAPPLERVIMSGGEDI